MSSMASRTSFGFILIFFLTFQKITSDQETYKMCAYENYDSYACKGLEAGNSKVACVKVTDSAECSTKLKRGEIDFGLFEPEQAVLSSKIGKDDIKVIGEIRYEKMQNESYKYKAVVVVPAFFSGGFEELRDKSYCHPGFGSAHGFTDRILKHFERRVVEMPCKETVSGVEQEIAQLSGFFKSACRPGAWAQDFQMDNRLKSRFKNLCDLCDSKDCKYNMRMTGSEDAVLNCLTRESGGDVAYVSYYHVQKYFGLLPGYDAKGNASNYKLMCEDGSLRPISGSEPCTWFRQPWPMLLARRDLANELQVKILGWLDSGLLPSPGDIWLQPFRKLILSSSTVALNISSPKTVANYINRGVDEDSTGSSCRKHVKWCTISIQQKNQCEILAKAALTNGLRPKLECISSQNMWNCMHHIANGNADIMSLDTEYGYIARKIYNLTTVVFEDGGHDAYYQIIAVIKADSQIKNFRDIKYKKACFPEYRGLGWVSFVRTMKKQGILKENRPVEDILGSSCAPGAMDVHHNLNPISKQNKLCQLCPTSNTSDPCSIEDSNVSNPYYGDLGALKCLMAEGDVGFVDYMRLLTGGELIGNIESSKFRVVCRNGSLSGILGLNVDADCALSTGIRGEIVSRKERSGVEARDTSELLLNMDKWFGTFVRSFEDVYRMYKTTLVPEDSLFRNGTIMLVQKDNMNFKMVEYYINLMKEGKDDAPTPNSTNNLAPSLLIIFFISYFHL